jgi:hypothetical protein
LERLGTKKKEEEEEERKKEKQNGVQDQLGKRLARPTTRCGDAGL